MKLDIIGNGRIALALIKKIVFEDKIFPNLMEINIWSRRKIKILRNSFTIDDSDTLYEDIINMKIQDLNLKCYVSLNYHYYECLDELKSIVINSKEDDVLIITSKYNLNELYFVDNQCKEKFDYNNKAHIELLINRYRHVFANTETYDLLSEEKRKARIIKDFSCFKKQHMKLQKCVKELSSSTNVGIERLYNLNNAVVGIINLAKVLQKYKGLIINMVNEIEVTNMLLLKYSKIDAFNIISLCDNDNIRAKYFLKKEIEKSGFIVKSICLEYLGPHNHNGFLPKEKIVINNEPISSLFSESYIDELLEKVKIKVNSLGEEIFLKKGSSDEDTVDSIYKFLVNYTVENSSYNQIIRLSCFSSTENLFYGKNVIVNKRKLLFPDTNSLGYNR